MIGSCDEVTVSVDEGNVVVMVYIDVVREIPHNRHLIKIEVCGVKETVAMGMENWPGNRKQDVIYERLCHSLEGSVQRSLPIDW